MSNRPPLICRHGIFTKGQCEAMIRLGENIPPRFGGVPQGRGQRRLDGEKRKALVREIREADTDFDSYVEKIRRVVLEMNDKYFGFDMFRHERPFANLATYEAGGKFHEHIDLQSSTMQRTVDRKISVSVLLSDPDDYDGGDFIVGGLPVDQTNCGQGGMVLYPSWRAHKVQPVTSGKRITFCAFFSGPSWR